MTGVPIMFDAAPSLIRHVRSGKLRVLAAASSEPNRLLPGVPEAFASFMRDEMAKWAPVVRPAGVKAE